MLFLVLLSLFALSTAQHHSTTPPPDAQATLDKFKAVVRQEIVKLWSRVDTNGDHKFTASDMHQILDDYDENHDHQVSMHEFIDRFAHNQPSLQVIAKGLFLEFDMNHDNHITESDLDLYYQKIDTNDNGNVEESEFVHYFTEIFSLLYIIQINQGHHSTPSPIGK